MKPEEFEVYVIPPNFMEGGTLFGGLLKTRNTVEAVILGLAVGVPVLHLPFSLTVRVVILCLTALPLVLLALIGVSGMSLSAFIRLFFCFLHNRRILSRDGTQGGKNGKTLLPSWAQQRKSDCEAEDPPLPKSRSRFSVDLKQRSVTQFKTFLQEEEAVQPLNALADYIPIEKIEHGVIYTRDHRYVKVVEVVPVNFLLRSAREQRSIIYSFISYESVTYLAGRGITCGTGNGRYAPDTPITVRQWATMICRAFDKAKQLGTWRVSNYTPEYRETSGVGRRKLMTMDEVLRMDIDKALILIRGKNVLEVDKYDYSKHPEAKKLRPSKAASHVPAWRANQPQEKQTPSAPPSQAADKKPAQKKKPASAEKVVAVTKESIMKKKEDT